MEQPQQTSQTYKWIEATIPISLSPVYQKSIRKGIEKFLERLLNQFVKEFNGVLLALKNIKLISTLSEIKNESPFIQVHVSFGAWVFCPFADAVIGKF
jgi:DNA-directed RNA polymerase subunit E'/Rpb7